MGVKVVVGDLSDVDIVKAAAEEADGMRQPGGAVSFVLMRMSQLLSILPMQTFLEPGGRCWRG